MRRIVLFPAPDGPKSTVHCDVRLKLMRRVNVPTRCSMSAVRNAESGTTQLLSPPIDEDERQKRDDEKKDGCAVSLTVAKVLYLVVHGDRKRSRGAGNIAADHEHHAELTDRVGEAEHGGGEDRAPREREQNINENAQTTCAEKCRGVENLRGDAGKSAGNWLHGERQA